jgi:hypothetical protein
MEKEFLLLGLSVWYRRFIVSIYNGSFVVDRREIIFPFAPLTRWLPPFTLPRLSSEKLGDRVIGGQWIGTPWGDTHDVGKYAYMIRL